MSELPAKDYYSTSWVAQGILQQCKRRFVTMRWPGQPGGTQGMRRYYNAQELEQLKTQKTQMWGKGTVDESGRLRQFFEIHGVWGTRTNPVDLSYFVDSGVVEIIPEVSTINDLERSDTLIVDLDPKDPELFTFEHLRWATRVVHAAITVKDGPLDGNFKLEAWKLRFSGNRSFHIYLRFKKPYPLEDMRQVLKENLDPVTKLFPVLSYHNSKGGSQMGPAKKDFILIDIGATSRHRCVRSLWSLHAKTGLVCVPVFDLESFQRESAQIRNVLNAGPLPEIF